MYRLLHILKTFIYPPVPMLLITAPVATVMLIYSFTDPDAYEAVKYISYFSSAYALTAICARIPVLIPWIRQWKNNSRLVKRYSGDVQWRAKTTLQGSLIVNGLYAGLQLISGFLAGTSWHYTLSGYYTLLAVMRWVLLRYISVSAPGTDVYAEYRRYRFCGIVMLLINQALVVIVGLIVLYDRGVNHPPIITIAMAVYTFTCLPLAISNLIKYKKYASPVLSAAKTLSFTSALVSLLSLETSMLSAFGTSDNFLFRRIITGITGFSICAIELAMALHMIIVSTKTLNQLHSDS